MNFKNHLMVSAGAGASVSAAVGEGLTHTLTPEGLLIMAASLLGGALPDIDHASSKVGRKFRVLSTIISTLFEHRGITHSIIFIVGVWYTLKWSFSHLLVTLNLEQSWMFYFDNIIVGFCAGILSHALADACTKSGVKLFYPLGYKFRLPVLSWFRLSSGSKLEPVVASLLIASFVGASLLTSHYGLLS